MVSKNKRIIIEMDVDYWNDEMRRELMQYLIHNLQVIEEKEINDDNGNWIEDVEITNFKGRIIEPCHPYPDLDLFLQEPDDKIYQIKWD